MRSPSRTVFASSGTSASLVPGTSGSGLPRALCPRLSKCSNSSSILNASPSPPYLCRRHAQPAGLRSRNSNSTNAWDVLRATKHWPQGSCPSSRGPTKGPVSTSAKHPGVDATTPKQAPLAHSPLWCSSVRIAPRPCGNSWTKPSVPSSTREPLKYATKSESSPRATPPATLPATRIRIQTSRSHRPHPRAVPMEGGHESPR